MARSRPATTSSSSYQGSAAAAMAASYSPLHAHYTFPYYYGYAGGYSENLYHMQMLLQNHEIKDSPQAEPKQLKGRLLAGRRVKAHHFLELCTDCLNWEIHRRQAGERPRGSSAWSHRFLELFLSRSTEHAQVWGSRSQQGRGHQQLGSR